MSYRVDFETVPWESPLRGVRHKCVVRGARRLRLVEYSREMEPHWCEKGHVGYMLEGRFEIRFGERALVFEPGDGIFIPAGREHRHMGKVLSETARVVFVEDV